jgi:hypothetical protein
MAGINYPRVLLGGLAAGIVANICDYVTNTILMADDIQRMLVRRNLDPGLLTAPSVAVTWIVVDFVLAFLIVFSYAAARPRLGAGPKTAVTMGLVIYLATTAVVFGFQGMGLITPDVFWKNAALTLVTVILASLTGGAVYKEESRS